MVQGTGSSVGKSVLVTAFCRLFARAGYRVAPFKAQNMALNSAVTADGGEIGRAQAVQAEASGVDPTVDMNPILLKPEEDFRSQVVVRGQVYATLTYREYNRLKPELLEVVRESLERLRRSYDLIVIEGAGSPAEVNLKADEIVNMRIARLAEAPVLLVGDIDRGGVFASLVGTLELLEPEERSRVRGFIINKFRGDASLLKPGLEFLQRRTGIPVLGVVPYFRDILVAAEDSVSLEEGGGHVGGNYLLDVAVVRLPRISNFDDFEPLAAEPGVRVRFIRNPNELNGADLVILPGTKSTVADLEFVRRTGLADLIRERAASGTLIMGICGGYQMLGREIRDPRGVESASPCVSGLDLLPVVTTFVPRKTTQRVRATVAGDASFLLVAGHGMPLRAYEIHMGQTRTDGAAYPFVVTERQGLAVADPDGATNASGNVMGTYLHGLFQNSELRAALLRAVAARKGVAPHPRWGSLPSATANYDRLADLVRSNVDITRILALVGHEGRLVPRSCSVEACRHDSRAEA
jgi:adenosylcobyric acid synthase